MACVLMPFMIHPWLAVLRPYTSYNRQRSLRLYQCRSNWLSEYDSSVPQFELSRAPNTILMAFGNDMSHTSRTLAVAPARQIAALGSEGVPLAESG